MQSNRLVERNHTVLSSGLTNTGNSIAKHIATASAPAVRVCHVFPGHPLAMGLSITQELARRNALFKQSLENNHRQHRGRLSTPKMSPPLASPRLRESPIIFSLEIRPPHSVKTNPDKPAETGASQRTDRLCCVVNGRDLGDLGQTLKLCWGTSWAERFGMARAWSASRCIHIYGCRTTSTKGVVVYR